jgi:peptide/nickel transport system substrate-binding protein
MESETKRSFMNDQRRLSRRTMLRGALAVGLTIPAAGALLAACGGDDEEDPTVTSPAGETTATPASEATPTEAMDEPTPTEAVADATPTEAMTEATPTEAMEEPTPTESGGGASELVAQYQAFVAAMGVETEPAQSEGGVLVEGRLTDFSFFSILADGGAYPECFEDLVILHIETLEPMPWLAIAWEANDDATVWTFSLREGILFQDGTPMTAEDVVATYAFGSASYGFQIITHEESFEAVDPATVQVNLSSPNTFALYQAGFLGIKPAAILAEIDPETAGFTPTDPIALGEVPEKVIGTGAFRFAEKQAEFVRFVRHDDYWGGKPHLDEIVITPVGDGSALVSLLQTGEIDIAGGGYYGGIEQSAVPELEGTDILTSPYNSDACTNIQFNFNPEVTTLFQDIAVRQALFHALDRQQLLESILFGYGTVPAGIVPPFTWYANPEGITVQYDYDPEAAAQLLDEAGWVLDGEYRAKDGQQLAFELLSIADPVQEAFAVALQEYWRAIGVNVTLNVLSDTLFYESFGGTNDYQAVLAPGSSYTINFLYGWFHTQSITDFYNRGSYSNPEVDELLDALSAAIDRDETIDIITQAQNALLADPPTIPICYPQEIGAYNSRVHNFYPNYPAFRFNVATWWIEE